MILTFLRKNLEEKKYFFIFAMLMLQYDIIMKKSSLLFLLASCMLLTACRFSGSSEEGIVQTDDDPVKIVEDDEPEMDDDFYMALLDAFCQKHYDNKLKGKYVANSIHDIVVSQDDEHTVKIEGKHSFKGKVGNLHPYDDRIFWATVHQEDRITFVINFSRELANPAENIPGLSNIALPKINTGDIPFEFVYRN